MHGSSSVEPIVPYYYYSVCTIQYGVPSNITLLSQVQAFPLPYPCFSSPRNIVHSFTIASRFLVHTLSFFPFSPLFPNVHRDKAHARSILPRSLRGRIPTCLPDGLPDLSPTLSVFFCFEGRGAIRLSSLQFPSSLPPWTGEAFQGSSSSLPIAYPRRHPSSWLPLFILTLLSRAPGPAIVMAGQALATRAPITS